MMSQAEISKLLADQILDVDTQWSLGTFGGIAEFSRDPGEAVTLSTSEQDVVAVTARGGIAIRSVEGLRPFASESITKQSWSHRVALCLSKDACAMSRRTVLTELGPDGDALRAEDRSSVLFDLGLDALQADLCIRIADGGVVAALREHLGRSVFEPGNPAMGIILSANPHRVFISRIGRVEVYQPIPPVTGKSPDGPHTHVLPKLLRSRRTHPATEPIPDDWIPCAHFYPSHPAKDAMGDFRSFDHARHDDFQRLLGSFGSPESNAIKRWVIDAVAEQQPPFAPETAASRSQRVSLRVALRQMKALDHPSRSLPAWLEAFDRVEPETDEDEAAKQHEH
jgi:hypothetical protein